MKANFTLMAVMTLNGKIARHSEELVNWSSQEDKELLKAEIEKADLLIMGRKTYETVKNKIKKKCLVFSRKKFQKSELIASGKENIIFINPQKKNLNDFLMKNNLENILVLGGKKTYDWFFENKLVNDLLLTIEPIIFKKGLSLIEKDYFKKSLKLMDFKKLNSQGTIFLHYKT
ncbi:MAG: dihydrofolate reductase family protein [Minisyncoccales bacterium]